MPSTNASMPNRQDPPSRPTASLALVELWEQLKVIGSWIIMLPILAGLGWVFLGFLGTYPAIRSSLKFDRPAVSAQELIAQVAARKVAEELGVVEPAVEFFLPANVTIYIDRNTFEGIPYPQQSTRLALAVNPWCSTFRGNRFPFVTLRDVRTGERIASYNCAGGYSASSLLATSITSVLLVFAVLIVAPIVTPLFESFTDRASRMAAVGAAATPRLYPCEQCGKQTPNNGLCSECLFEPTERRG